MADGALCGFVWRTIRRTPYEASARRTASDPMKVSGFGRPNDGTRLELTESVVRDIAAKCKVLHERERIREKRNKKNEIEP